MSEQSTYLTAPTILALAMAAPILLAAQPGQDGPAHAQGAGHAGPANGQAVRQPPVRAQRPPEQRAIPRAPAQSQTRPAANNPESGRNRQTARPTQHGQAQHGQTGTGQTGAGQARPDQTRPGQTRAGQTRPDQLRAGQVRAGQAPPAAPQHRALAPQGHAEANRTPRPSARPANVQALRRNLQAQRRYRAGAYRAPQGYAQRRWAYGDRLPSSYYARNYWISDFPRYSLFAPPSGLVWVRVGADALLIDEYSGEIIQVRYGIFY